MNKEQIHSLLLMSNRLMLSIPLSVSSVSEILGVNESEWERSGGTLQSGVLRVCNLYDGVVSSVQARVDDLGVIIFLEIIFDRDTSINIKEFEECIADSPVERGPADLAPNSNNYYASYTLPNKGMVSISFNLSTGRVGRMAVSGKKKEVQFPRYVPLNGATPLAAS